MTNFNRKVNFAAITATVVILSLIWGHFSVTKEYHEKFVHDSLSTVLKTTVQALKSWVASEKTTIQYWSQKDSIIQLTNQILKKKNTETNQKIQSQFKEILTPVIKTKGYQSYFIFNKSLSIISSSDSVLTNENDFLKQHSKRIKSVWDGDLIVTSPLLSKLETNEKKNQTKSIFALAPIYNENKKINAVLAFQINPQERFSKLLQRGRIGSTGETYAFNKQYLMMSDSRFIDQLKNMGFIEQDDETSIGKVYIKDPGVNLTTSRNLRKSLNVIDFPPTFMANSAVMDKVGFNVLGYNDYRGVKVVGVWKWIDFLNIGIATEIDFDEAYTTLLNDRLIFLFISAIMILLIWIGRLYIIKFQVSSLEHNFFLKNFNEELEQKVQSRTNELAKANKAKSDFLSNMSHEIRTPLTSILGHTELLMESELNDNAKSYVKQIYNSGDFLLGIINNILDLSKIESNELVLDLTPVNLSDCVNEVFHILNFSASRANNSLIKDIQIESNALYIADILRLKQILFNLLSNAIKFTHHGEVKLTIKIIESDNKFDFIYFSVSDNGIGIPKEKQRLIFDSFKQSDSSTTKTYGGTGLGLSITKTLIHLMEGEIFLDSKEEEGSNFYFTIPLEKSDSVDTETKSHFLESLNSPQIAKTKILIVEDNEINQKLLHGILVKIGFNKELISLTANGVEALENIKKQQPDLIFLDCMMPIMDGYETSENIRKNKNYDEIHIIAITANAFEEDKKRCFETGMNDFVAKPFSKKSIIKAVRQYIHKRIN